MTCFTASISKKGVHATTAIEGNSLSEEQVGELLEERLELPPSKAYLGQEVRNIVNACNLIGTAALAGEGDGIRIRDLEQYNVMVLDGLPLPEEVTPGKLRNYGVSVGRYRGAPAEDLGYLLKHLCEWLSRGFAAPDDGLRLVYGILQATVAHVYLAWIHPFGDGNGRTARLLEFRILLEAGAPTPAAHLMSNHYNLTRTEYYRHLDLSSKREDGLYAFVEYALQGLVDGLDEQIKFIEAQLLTMRWIDYVRDRFEHERDTPVTTRRRLLMQELFWARRAVPIEGILNISERIAEAYAGLSLKTLRRDLRRLGKMGLLAADSTGYKPRFESLWDPPEQAGKPGESLL